MITLGGNMVENPKFAGYDEVTKRESTAKRHE
jgi:hypothetical protein